MSETILPSAQIAHLYLLQLTDNNTTRSNEPVETTTVISQL